jgi:hypothetical protein
MYIINCPSAFQGKFLQKKKKEKRKKKKEKRKKKIRLAYLRVSFDVSA